MKILVVSDIHAHIPWLRWISRVSPQYDLAAICGDVLDAVDHKHMLEQIEDVSDAIQEIATKVALAVVSGNHDCVEDAASEMPAPWLRSLARPGIWVDGDRFTLMGHRFSCIPWGVPLAPSRPNEIWLSHVPPAESSTGSTEDGYDGGDFELTELCRKGDGPCIVLCGHVHTPHCWYEQIGSTLAINPGRADNSPIPAHVILDLVAQSATRFWPGSAPETISLIDQPIQRVPLKLTRERIEQLLDHAISNMRAEGYVLTEREIATAREKLQRFASRSDK